MKITASVQNALTAIILIFTGCNLNFTIEGNGDPVTTERSFSCFREVNLGGNFLVNVTPGETNKLIIRAESNLLPYISSRVSGKELIIEVKGIHNLEPSLPVVIDVITPALKAVRQSGSGEIHTGNFRTDHFDITQSGSGSIISMVDCETIDVTVSGAGSVILEGSGKQGEFIISGSGDISAYDYSLDICNALISGSGCMFVNIYSNLTACISGSGTLCYHGDPSINHTITGTGRVIKGR